MAPRTRSNRRAQVLAKSNTGSERGDVHNTTGLPGLPDELYLEIASHVPSMPLPTEYPLEGEAELEDYQARHMTFAALTQTCQSLRRVFLKYLWERIEVFDGMQTPIGPLPSTVTRKKLQKSKSLKSRLFVRELLRQLEIVTIREPSLAEYVREMNVVLLPDPLEDPVLEELAKCAASLPNLRTVQLVFNSVASSAQAQKLLGRYTYPQVTTLSISHPFHNIYRDAEEMRYLVAACPNLRRLAPCLNDLCLNAVFDSPKLEVVGPLFFRKRYAGRTVPVRSSKSYSVVDIVKSKELRDISIHSDNFVDKFWKIEYLEPLKQLEHLHTIRIGVHEEISTRFLEDYTEKLQSWVDYCRELLSGRQRAGKGEIEIKKRVMVMFYSESGNRRIETYGVH